MTGKENKVARPTARRTARNASATCLDPASGLYHPQHFRLSLDYEHSRMERAEKPLGLIILRLPGAGDEAFAALSGFLKGALGPLDLAARLGGPEVGILIPEAGRDRAARLLTALGQEYGPGGRLAGPAAIFGAALARPFQGGGPDDLLRKARDSMGPAQEAARKVLSGSGPWAEADTALAGPERDSLFNGFGTLALVLNPGGRRS
jgi:GGDEF domain-containing protein